MYAIIFAGGEGTRLWPVSRKNDPKQTKPFIDEETLLQKTFNRVSKLTDKIFVSTNVDYGDLILGQLPELGKDKLILEPAKRNTAAAVGLAVAVIAKMDPEAVVTNVWSDHFIRDEENYRRVLSQAEQFIQKYPDYLIDIVIKPEHAETGYGYLEQGELLEESDNISLYKVERFVEKPDLKTAEEYLASGRYFWNPAMFVFKASTLLKLYKEFVPEIYEGLVKIQAAWGTEEQETVLGEIYPTLEKIAIDYAIFERAPYMAMIPAEIGWRDIGDWRAVHDILTDGKDGNVTKGETTIVDTSGSLIYATGGKRVVAVGVEDLVVIDTPDALLVMDKKKGQSIKKAIEELEKSGEEKLL